MFSMSSHFYMVGQDRSKQRVEALGMTEMASQAEILEAPEAHWSMDGAYEKPRGMENDRRTKLSLRERTENQEHNFKRRRKGHERLKCKTIYPEGPGVRARINARARGGAQRYVVILFQ